MKVGFAAILGRPNVGKSTLLNGLLSKKISIVSPRAQTTRDAVSGVLTEKDAQIVFVDTPGIYYGEEKLDSHMRRAAFSSSRDVDVLLYLLDASVASLEEDFRIFRSIDSAAPRFFVLNKIDLIHIEQAEKLTAEIRESFPDVTIIRASFIENFGFKEVKEAILPFLKEGQPFYPEDVLSDKDMNFQAREIIREKLLHFLREEVPHQSAVRIGLFEEKKGGIVLEATVICDKPAHKAIIIGKGGAMIKKISMAARQEMERVFHTRVLSLKLDVECVPGWRSSPGALNALGYGQ